MGLKPSDCASVQGRADTAEFLVMFETALGVSDISQSEAFILTIDQSQVVSDCQAGVDPVVTADRAWSDHRQAG